MRRTKHCINANYRILIVDDDQGIVDSMVFILKRKGYTVYGLTDPLEAIENIHTKAFDMLILDYLMYPINGDKVVESIRKTHPDLYILLISGNENLNYLRKKTKALGIQDYGEKSDRFDVLLHHVDVGIKKVSERRAYDKVQDE
ncbi:response regulator [Dehalobacter sp. DCM]|uniref:response regulator n=1 Tax=Dehalobacter sp. DCM TaxID=2907827 RepID=UPI00308211E0|nr:response regulator [Dehalobacter sp. DCM]